MDKLQEVEMMKQEILEKEKKIKELELEITKLDNRNEYNENLYHQHYLSLKRNFGKKIQDDIQLELDGLEDIAGTLSDTQKEKIIRRIQRIYKILLKSRRIKNESIYRWFN